MKNVVLILLIILGVLVALGLVMFVVIPDAQEQKGSLENFEQKLAQSLVEEDEDLFKKNFPREVLLWERLNWEGREKIKEGIEASKKEFLDAVVSLAQKYEKDFFYPVSPPMGSLKGVKGYFLGNRVPADLRMLKPLRDGEEGMDHVFDVTRENIELREIVLEDLRAAQQAARQEKMRLVVASGYRSFEYQERLYGQSLEQKGRETTEKELALPGFSQHQLGLAVDFWPIEESFEEKEVGKWFLKNSARFGFSLSYPKNSQEITGYDYEPWHYRYISPEGAEIQEKYFGGIQRYFLEFMENNFEILREFNPS